MGQKAEDTVKCPKCKKDMEPAEFLAMGVKFKCFDCHEVIMEHDWEMKNEE
jgi:predicted  nucleic acid-binding Zn ribbon protein